MFDPAFSTLPLADTAIIRPVRDEDGPALKRLIAACFAEYEGCPFDDAEFPELVAPAASYAAKGAAFWVMLCQDQLVGSIAIIPVVQHNMCDIAKVYLAAAHRGGGKAQALMQQAELSAADFGLPDMALWTDTRFTRAHGFYEKLGFVRQPVIRYLADLSHSWEYRYERRRSAVKSLTK